MAVGESLPEPIGRVFAEQGIARRLRRHGRLFTAGDAVAGIHLVTAGHLRIVRGGPRSVVLHHERPGGMLGETALFGGFPYPATAIATEPTTCLLLPRARVMRLLVDEPAAAAFFLRRLATRLHGVIARLDQVTRDSVAARLARHLSERAAGSTGPVSLGMTQAELAEELGTVREVVVRELRRLVSAGIIASASRGLYRVVDPERLTAMRAGAGP